MLARSRLLARQTQRPVSQHLGANPAALQNINSRSQSTPIENAAANSSIVIPSSNFQVTIRNPRLVHLHRKFDNDPIDTQALSWIVCLLCLVLLAEVLLWGKGIGIVGNLPPLCFLLRADSVPYLFQSDLRSFKPHESVLKNFEARYSSPCQANAVAREND